MGAIRTRLSIWMVMLIVLIAAAGIWMVNHRSSGPGPRTLNVQLLNKNDGKDNCPNDGNAGTGNDGKCQPPGGGYGQNPNDGKDNCPNDGNAGKGNDTKNNGGCVIK